MIYFIKNLNNYLIKIGYTENEDSLKFRLLTLNSQTKSNNRLLSFCEGNYKIEKLLHKEFREDRVNGEWFKENNRLIKFIDRINRLKLLINQEIKINNKKPSTLLDLAIKNKDFKLLFDFNSYPRMYKVNLEHGMWK